MNRVFIDIKQELLKINFNEYTFYYMVLFLLKFSEKGKKKKITRKDSWKLDLPDILNIEIIKCNILSGNQEVGVTFEKLVKK